MTELQTREIATGLRFPEGPIALPDGSVLLVELARSTLSRVDVATGAVEVVADCGGGPNGAAIGPDGAVYLCNNGGYFNWVDAGDLTFPDRNRDTHVQGSIQRVDLATGRVDTLYEACDGQRLVAPNDLVFDAHGGFWFTDHGVPTDDGATHPGLLYAKADGSHIRAAAFGTHEANGVGLSPAGDRVYLAETMAGRVWEWAVPEPGHVAPVAGTGDPDRSGGHLLYDAPDGHLYDSLAVDGDGWVCVATIGPGGVTAIAPDGATTDYVDVPGEPLVTNICFGSRTVDGADDPEWRTAFITAAATGRLVAVTWPRPGLALPH